MLGCRRKACRRKDGSFRVLRAIRISNVENRAAQDNLKTYGTGSSRAATNIGETLFGGKSPTPAQGNPFASTSTATLPANPFSSAKTADTQPSTSTQSSSASDLAETFAQKARISPPIPLSPPKVSDEPWPYDPSSYPSYHIDADKEYLAPASESGHVPSNARLDSEGGNSSAADEKAAFESAMDRTFQRFADRLTQNPEQVLRYEFAGHPLLYSKSDAVGKVLSAASEVKARIAASHTASLGALKIPSCPSCGAGRVFELQLTPHVIAELEAEEMSIEGMDWGTIIVGVCGGDCQEKGKVEGEVGYMEEWVGVQWEEIADNKKR